MPGSRVEWQWDDAQPDGVIADGMEFSLEFDRDEDEFLLWRREPGETPVLFRTIPAAGANSAALATDGPRIFLAIFASGATGCRVVALEAASGRKLWQTRLEGLGSVGHSRYFNRVQLQVVDGDLVAFGDEANGRYVEVLDPESGEQLDLRRL